MGRKIIVSEQDIAVRVQLLARQISTDYQGKEIEIICLVNSGSFFCADLVRQISVPVRIHFLGFSSYATGNNTGEVKVTLDIAEPLANKHLLIIEGIIISGRTPKFVFDYLKLRDPASIAYCAIGIKPKSLAVDLPVKYCAFEFESDLMVGGYGIGKGIEKALPYLTEI